MFRVFHGQSLPGSWTVNISAQVSGQVPYSSGWQENIESFLLIMYLPQQYKSRPEHLHNIAYSPWVQSAEHISCSSNTPYVSVMTDWRRNMVKSKIFEQPTLTSQCCYRIQTFHYSLFRVFFLITDCQISQTGKWPVWLILLSCFWNHSLFQLFLFCSVYQCTFIGPSSDEARKSIVHAI